MTSGPVIDVFARAVGPDLELLDARNQLLDEAVRRLVSHRHRDGHRHAALARRAIAGAHQRVGRLVHVGVRHDDHVILGTAEALHPLSGRTSARVDVLGDGGRADETDRLDQRVVEDRVHRLLVAIDDLEDPVR